MDNNDQKNKFLTVGTKECGIFCALIGLVIAVLLLTVGFWKTLMLAAFFLAGLFVGGVSDKKACISDLFDRWFGKHAEKVQATINSARQKQAARKAEPEEDEDGEDDGADDDADGDEAEDEEDASEDGDAEEIDDDEPLKDQAEEPFEEDGEPSEEDEEERRS